jgi:AbrB family looped-hinge helix DNA binding protein
MVKVRVGRRGQITIPSQIRRLTGIKEGDNLTLEVEGDNLVMRPIGRTLLDLRGSVPVPDAQDFEAIREEVIASRARKAAGNGG